MESFVIDVVKETAKGMIRDSSCEQDLYAANLETTVQELARRIGRDHAAAAIGTMGEVGRPFGLSTARVGQILANHGLRELVKVVVNGPLSIALTRYEERQDRRWEAYRAEFLPRTIREGGGRKAKHVLHLPRAIPEGFAVIDDCGREYWIRSKVAPLLEPHAAIKKEK